jgi:hypothetical protein
LLKLHGTLSDGSTSVLLRGQYARVMYADLKMGM